MKIVISIFWLVSILLSMFWGIYGVKQESEDIRVENEAIKKEENKRAMYFTKRIGIFLSEFIGSLAGWCCLWILGIRLGFPNFNYLKFGTIEIFLVIGATIGIAGYSYKIAEAVEKCK